MCHGLFVFLLCLYYNRMFVGNSPSLRMKWEKNNKNAKWIYITCRITIGGDCTLLSWRNSSNVTISLPGEDERVLVLGPTPRWGCALWGMWSYGRVELRERVCWDWLRPMTSSLERLADRAWRSDVSKTKRNTAFALLLIELGYHMIEPRMKKCGVSCMWTITSVYCVRSVIELCMN